MVPSVLTRQSVILQGLTLLAMTSCESTDRRLAEFAQQASEQQAKQNERQAEQTTAVVKQSHEVAAAAHDLVAQDAAARRDWLAAQQQFQQQTHLERARLDGERRTIESDRQAAAQAAIREPVIGQAILTVGLALAALLPLVLTGYALRRLPEHAASDQLLNDQLLNDWLLNDWLHDEWTRPETGGNRPTPLTNRGRGSRLIQTEGPASEANPPA